MCTLCGCIDSYDVRFHSECVQSQRQVCGVAILSHSMNLIWIFNDSLGLQTLLSSKYASFIVIQLCWLLVIKFIDLNNYCSMPHLNYRSAIERGSWIPIENLVQMHLLDWLTLKFINFLSVAYTFVYNC